MIGPMSRDRAISWLKFALALGVSIAFTALFLLNTNLGDVADALAGADYVYVVPALALFALSLAARALRWQYLFRPHYDRDWRLLTPSLLVGYAGNNLLPLRAGELLRAQHASDHVGVPRMVSFGTFIMERLFDFMALSSLVLAGILIAEQGTAYVAAAATLFGATIAGLAVALYFANNPARARGIVGGKVPLVPERFREQLADLAESFLLGCACLTDRGSFLAVSAVTCVAWGLEFGMYWVLSGAFDLHPSFVSVAFAGAAANIALSIPSAQGGIGPFDLTAIKALAAFSIAGDAVKAYVVALHIFLVVPVSIAGMIVLWRSTLPSSRPEVAAAPAAAAFEPGGAAGRSRGVAFGGPVKSRL